MQRVGDRARAVIALGLERAVPAAPHVGAGRDFVGRLRSRARPRLRLRRGRAARRRPRRRRGRRLGLRAHERGGGRGERGARLACRSRSTSPGRRRRRRSGRGGPAGGARPPRFPARIRRPLAGAARLQPLHRFARARRRPVGAAGGAAAAGAQAASLVVPVAGCAAGWGSAERAASALPRRDADHAHVAGRRRRRR